MKPPRIFERIHTLLSREEESQDNSELQSSEYSSYSDETRATLDALRMVFDARRAAHERLTPKLEPGVRRLGGNEAGFGPDFVDWRSQLPLDHPVRQMGLPVIENGSPEADDQLLAAHDALQAAMRTVSSPARE